MTPTSAARDRRKAAAGWPVLAGRYRRVRLPTRCRRQSYGAVVQRRRGEELQIATDELNEEIATKLEELEIEDQDVAERLKKELKRGYQVFTNPDRLDKIARDFSVRYSTLWETGKAMLVCIDKITVVRMHGLLVDHWQNRIVELEGELLTCDEQERAGRERQLA